jgi:hypothetical protein
MNSGARLRLKAPIDATNEIDPIDSNYGAPAAARAPEQS